MSTLEQRYRRLLLVYPRSYRKARGDEMLDTLLESSAPGASRPAARDAKALILGGLKVRSGSDQRLTVAESVRLVVLLAACLDIVFQANYWFTDVRDAGGYRFLAYDWISLALGLLAVATVALAWSRWPGRAGARQPLSSRRRRPRCGYTSRRAATGPMRSARSWCSPRSRSCPPAPAARHCPWPGSRCRAPCWLRS